MSKFARKGAPPPGFEHIESTLNALSDELRDRCAEHYQGNKRGESTWPVHQINWQRTRYVHDMFYKYGKVSQAVYDYCCKNRMIDAALSAKWLEPGYENLCSLHVIDPKNHTFMTASICRVPKQNLPPGTVVSDPYSGCKGCASGSAGQANIFGNKYGQKLAAIQIRREQLLEKELAQEEQKALDEAAERKKRKKDKKKQKKQRDGLWANEEEEEAAAPEERPD